ncbi:MAG: ATP-dependent RecD-like DNA helicase [Candidatus Latescibacteria bacterium]|nr:ATP-dependent RecD-like DNA helicase [Candidatus Latescibacterota bacterium]
MSETFKGYIDRITYHNPENGYTIARLVPEGRKQKITVVGLLADLKEGESLELQGAWMEHPQYGRQLKIEDYRQVYPSTLEGIQKYLGSGLIKGVGPMSARRIVEHFGEETLEVIDSNPQRLEEVPKLGRNRVDLIARAWEEQRRIKDVMIFLQSHGVSTGFAVKIFKEYGQEAITRVQANPYRLERDIHGIGFTTADLIAQKLGFAHDSLERIQAGIRYLLDQCADDGHVYLPVVELMERAKELLGVNAELFPPALEMLRSDDGIVTEDLRYYLPSLYHAEVGAASSLRRLLRTPAAVALSWKPEEEGELQLASGQIEAVRLVETEKVMVLTGGPGTGKTTVTRVILDLFEQHGLKVALCSPTGRAARRLAETTGREAKTIHRLLEFIPAERQFNKNYDNRLEVDALIVDEASMIDIVLLNALLRALPDTARAVIVGDVDQLPSVGPGSALRDIIASEKVPLARLDEIFRQARESQIIVNAHRVNQGQMPLVNNREGRDFFFIEESEPEKVAGLIEELCARRLPDHSGFHPYREIQVLTPMYRGETGALMLNQRLQGRLNPDGRAYVQGGVEYRIGDKVMQIKNNYDKGVFNGDMGVIAGLSIEDQRLEVDFDVRVSYEFANLDELTLAYAISTHRSQGSEFPAVVLPLTTQHYVMLQRNLLYTALTRAQRMIVVVGTRKALQLAVDNNQVAQRFTTLAPRLRGQTGERVEALQENEVAFEDREE